MKKRILSLLLAALMIFSLLPTMALAETTQNCQGGDGCTHKAAIGTTHYDTLADAIAAVPTDGTETEIIMIDDEVISTGVTVPATKKNRPRPEWKNHFQR